MNNKPDVKIRLGYKAEDFSKAQYYRVRKHGQVENGQAHLCLCAPTRTGKFTDVLAPVLMEYEGSVIVIDPKGQAAAVTGPERARMGQRVIILNPFQILPDVLTANSPEHFRDVRGVTENCTFNAQFNPMSSLDPASDAFGADCDSLADAIVIHEEGGERHWSDSAKQLISGIMMHLLASPEDKGQNLTALRNIVCGPMVFAYARKAVAKAKETGDLFVEQKLARFAEDKAEESREIRSIISTANTQTGFIGNKAISRCLGGSSFRSGFRDLRRQPTTVYLVLPTRYIATCAKWFRVVIAAALDDLLREPEAGDLPVLAILDEFGNLGRLASMEKAMGLAAGYHLQLFPVIQDLTQLKEHYKEAWETFLANAGVRLFFAPRDFTTQEYVSNLCGTTEVMRKSVSTNEVDMQRMMQGFSGVGTSIAMQKEPLYDPHQVGQIEDHRFLLFMEGVGGKVFEGWRRPYFRALNEFGGKYSPDPYHRAGA